MNQDAHLARDMAKADLEKQERFVYEERRKRDMELAEVRKEAEERRMQHERIERRLVSDAFFVKCAEFVGARKSLGCFQNLLFACRLEVR